MDAMSDLLDHAVTLLAGALALAGVGLLFVASYVLLIPDGPVDWILAGVGGIVSLAVGLIVLHRQDSALSDRLWDGIEDILMHI